MRKTIIFLNYQRTIPPFMLTQIEFASEIYERVYYITPKLINNNSEQITGKNIEIVEIKKKDWIKKLLNLPLLFFNPISLKNIKNAVTQKEIKTGFFVHHFTYLLTGNLLKDYTANLLKFTKIDSKEVIIVASWFSVEAYALALLKSKFHNIKTVSFAHSFEVDRAKNKFINSSFNSFKHKYIDYINFISRNVYKHYIIETNLKDKEILKKIKVKYLGTYKKFEDLNNRSNKPNIELLSCSSVIPVKRIHLILEFLKTWNGIPIKWTHIGDGPLLNDLKIKAKNVEETNMNISIEFKGFMNNINVQKYFVENSVDLFINVSESEGIPVSLMESISYGVPGIVTNVGGNGEIVNEKNGYLLKSDFRSEEINIAINNYLSLSDEEILALRYRNYRHWLENFNAEKNIFDFYNYINSLGVRND